MIRAEQHPNPLSSIEKMAKLPLPSSSADQSRMALTIAREVEVDGVGMGVLSDGTAAARRFNRDCLSIAAANGPCPAQLSPVGWGISTRAARIQLTAEPTAITADKIAKVSSSILLAHALDTHTT